MERTILILGLLVAITSLLVILLERLRSQEARPSDPNAHPSSSSGSGSHDAIKSKRRHWLVGVTGAAEGKKFHIGLRNVTIGRAVSNFVQVDDIDVSRVHCKISPVSGALQITDLQSHNKTFINDQEVQVYTLRDGDRLRIGKAEFLYQVDGQFSANDAFARKNAGQEALRPTGFAGYDQDPIEAVVLRALEQCNGDIHKVAQMTRLRLDIVEKYVKLIHK